MEDSREGIIMVGEADGVAGVRIEVVVVGEGMDGGAERLVGLTRLDEFEDRTPRLCDPC